LPTSGTKATAAEIEERKTAPTYLWSTFSNYNSQVDLCAPGERIYLDYFRPRDGSGTYAAGRLVNGTSFASPLVAGLAATLLAVKPDLTPSLVEELLTTTAKDLRYSRTASGYTKDGLNYGGTDAKLIGRDPYYGAGLPQINSALAVLNDAKNVKHCTTKTIPVQTYTGKKLTPQFAVRILGNSKALSLGTDYMLTYSNNKAIGKASVTISGIGGYTGSKKITFTIVPKKPNVKLKSALRAFTAKWSKSLGATRYQLRYCRGKQSWKTVTLAANKRSRLSSGLLRKTKYTVQMRAYRTVGGKRYYSGWSKAKTIRTK
jgi:hypothetical protein